MFRYVINQDHNYSERKADNDVVQGGPTAGQLATCCPRTEYSRPVSFVSIDCCVCVTVDDFTVIRTSITSF